MKTCNFRGLKIKPSANSAARAADCFDVLETRSGEPTGRVTFTGTKSEIAQALGLMKRGWRN